jgi:DNA topoisomerase-1
MGTAHPLAIAPPGDGLRWVNDGEPGFRRMRCGRGFRYVDAAGRAVNAPAVLQRIRKLAIPPAYRDVWICCRADGHLLATGVDARGRKQYRYHAEWRSLRDTTKFEHLRCFGQALPRIRGRVSRQLGGGAEPTRERVLATLARLLDTTWLRIGNDAYRRDNGSFGLSTLRRRHARPDGDELRLAFVGKGGVRHEARIGDRRVARIIRRCQELPGQQLFSCIVDDGEPQHIDSADVNAWLADAAGAAVTAKDFRTWHASVLALDLTLRSCSGAQPPSARSIVEQVARRLGNTPAVCKKAYIHPAVLALGESLGSEAARSALLGQRWVQRPAALRGLYLAERRLMGLRGAVHSALRRGQARPRTAAAAG